MTAGTHILAGILVATLLKLPVLPAAVGSIFPDIDVGKGLPPPYKRNLLNSHRGITHHPVIPLCLLVLVFFLRMKGFCSVSVYLLSFTVGYISHLLLDVLNPLGIPYKFSYYPRLTLKLMKTGKWGEIFVILLLISTLLAAVSVKDFQILGFSFDGKLVHWIKNLVEEVRR
jgi:inner membrane protein